MKPPQIGVAYQRSTQTVSAGIAERDGEEDRAVGEAQLPLLVEDRIDGLDRVDVLAVLDVGPCYAAVTVLPRWSLIVVHLLAHVVHTS